MSKKHNIKKEIFQWVVSIGVAVLLTLILRTYVIAAADVDGASMMPTLNNKDKIFVEKISLITDTFKRGQIVIFDSGNENDAIFVKRVIGVEGDTVEIKGGKVFLNNKELEEPYLNKGTITNPGTFLQENTPFKVKKGYVFVLGDNRLVSWDSRSLGPISINAIKGHVILRTYPFNNIKGF